MTDTLQPFRADMHESNLNTPGMTAQASFEQQQRALEFHAATTTPEALGNMSLHPGSFGELTDTEHDPRYFDRITAHDDQLVDQAEVQPRSEVERQIEALSVEQQKAVISEIACYLVAMRAHHLSTLALTAAAKYRQR